MGERRSPGLSFVVRRHRGDVAEGAHHRGEALFPTVVEGEGDLDIVSGTELDSDRAGHDVGAARLEDGRCNGCHLELSPRDLDDLRRLPDDAVATCEACGRILVR